MQPAPFPTLEPIPPLMAGVEDFSWVFSFAQLLLEWWPLAATLVVLMGMFVLSRISAIMTGVLGSLFGAVGQGALWGIQRGTGHYDSDSIRAIRHDGD